MSARNNPTPTGHYQNYFGADLDIYPDHSYYYHFSYNYTSTSAKNYISTWISGKWTASGDTLFFFPVIIYDTLRYLEGGSVKDSLVKSTDMIPGVISKAEYEQQLLYGKQQDAYGSPLELLLKKNKLYEIDSRGNVVKEKRKGNWSDRYFYTYFIKV